MGWKDWSYWAKGLTIILAIVFVFLFLYKIGQPMLNLAVSTNSVKLCQFVPERSWNIEKDRSDCYWYVAIKNNNKEACTKFAETKIYLLKKYYLETFESYISSGYHDASVDYWRDLCLNRT